MEQLAFRMTRSNLQFLKSMKLYIDNSGLFYHAMGSSGWLWVALNGHGRFSKAVECSGSAGSFLPWIGHWTQLWGGCGRSCAAMTGSEKVWTVLGGSGWEAGNSAIAQS